MNNTKCAKYKNNHHIVFLISLLTFAGFITVSIGSDNSDGLWMKAISQEFTQDLDWIKTEELGIEYVKKLYSSFKSKSTLIDANITVNEVVSKIQLKIDDIFSALNRAQLAIENMQILDNSTKTLSSLLPCVEDKNTDLNKKVSKLCGNLFGIILHNTPNDQLKVDYVLQKLKSKMWSMKNAIKQQYFISSWDVESYNVSPFIDCSQIDHMLLWRSYMARNNYVPKNIVLLIDHGGSLSRHQLQITKSVVKGVIDNLDVQDNVAVIAISNDWIAPQLNDECLVSNQILTVITGVPKFVPVTPNNKRLLYKFVDGLTINIGPTNHTLGLEKALKVIEERGIQNETVVLLYISRGVIYDRTDRNILKSVSEAATNITTPFLINSCIITEGKSTSPDKGFMEDLVFQNYNKYNLSTEKDAQGGIFVYVNSTFNIGFAVSRFFDVFNFNSSFNPEKRVSLPTWDYKSNDLTVTFSIGCVANNQFGLLGIDIHFMNLFEDVMQFSSNQKHHQYAFLMDLAGRVIIHPSFAAPTTVKEQLKYVDISYFENIPNFGLVKEKMLTEISGEKVVTQFGFTIKYNWSRVRDWYVVGIVTRDSNRIHTRPFQVNWPLNSSGASTINLVYKTLGNTENKNLCRHLNQVATLDAASLYLSSFCFQSPSSFHDMKNHLLVQDYMAYLQDTTRLLNNPGLKKGIKDEVAALAYILHYLRTQHLNSFKSKYIVRRYVATYNGVFEMFPGSILDQGLDPTKRPWFLQASEHRPQLILTPPYLDEGGAGYIVTVAYATAHVVVAADITYGYVYRMLLKRMPFCAALNITCFLMDDRGYLIYHPNLIDPNGHGPVEKQHIVHKESLVANDILTHKLFIQKMLCNSYASGTVQRYYRLNTSYTDVLMNSVQGEQCVSYYITAVPNTNIFIGMVNATCNVLVTFCPCSIVDRLCLNCNRMEQKECECPCECPLEDNKCADYKNINNPTCTWFPEYTSSIAHFHDYPEDNVELKSCFPASCSEEKTYYRCLGVTGCEWCKFDVDGSLLNNPFCASMVTCFNGIVGSITPYKNFRDIEIPRESVNVPVSIIVLFIIGILLVLCMFYIYHRSTNPSATERLYLSSTQDNHLRMSDLNLSDNNYNAVGNHRDKLLQDEKPDPVSPYCVTTSGYSRAAVAADSDHGYSTMTQHDESEHMSLAPVELDSLDDDLNSDSTSVSTSKPQKREAMQFTCLPKNNSIIVPVIVHRNMETT